MEVVQVRGVVESLTWDERGVGTLKFTDPSMLPVYIKELQKPELPKDLKKGDTVTVTGNQGQKHLFLLNMKRGESAPPLEPSSSAGISLSQAEQPPKTEDFNIPYSYKRIGPLLPLLVDPEGNIIDGLHRHAVDPDWRKEVVPWVRSRKDFLIARYHANKQRRTMPKEETQCIVVELANTFRNEGSAIGEISAKLSDALGITQAYVDQLLPRSLKLRTKPEGTPGRFRSSKSQPETLPDAKLDLETEAAERAKAVDSAAPQEYADLYTGPCPACGVKIQWDQERKIFARVN